MCGRARVKCTQPFNESLEERRDSVSACTRRARQIAVRSSLAARMMACVHQCVCVYIHSYIQCIFVVFVFDLRWGCCVDGFWCAFYGVIWRLNITYTSKLVAQSSRACVLSRNIQNIGNVSAAGLIEIYLGSDLHWGLMKFLAFVWKRTEISDWDVSVVLILCSVFIKRWLRPHTRCVCLPRKAPCVANRRVTRRVSIMHNVYITLLMYSTIK